MAVIELEQASVDRASVEELERLWDAPPAQPSGGAYHGILTRTLPLAWLVFFVAGAFAPAGDANAPVPLWEDVLGGVWLVALFVAGLAAVRRRGRAAFGASAVAASLGLPLAFGCALNGHHGALWWSFEFVTSAALLAASLVGLAGRKR